MKWTMAHIVVQVVKEPQDDAGINVAINQANEILDRLHFKDLFESVMTADEKKQYRFDVED